MNILQITSRIPFPLNDGGNIATYNVTAFLNKFGHKVTMAALNTSKHYQNPAVVANVAEVFATDIDTTVTIAGLIKGFFGKLPYNVSRFWSTEFQEQLAQILQQKNFDIIQLEGVYMAIYLPVLRQYSKAKIVLRAHNVEHQIWQRLSENEPALHKRFYMRYLARKVKKFEEEYVCLFDGIIAITEADAAWFKKRCATTQTTSIAAGVHLAKPEQISLENLQPTVAILGSLEWAPNVQGLEWLLAYVWPKVLQKLPHAQLHVAGKNPPEELLNRKLPNVTMHGMVPDATGFLLAHPVLAVPLHAGGGMRLKVVEAMALGRCIVSTRIGVEGVPVIHNEHALLADSADDFAAELVTALTNQNLQAAAGKNAYAMAGKLYGWEGLIRKFELFYKDLAGT